MTGPQEVPHATGEVKIVTLVDLCLNRSVATIYGRPRQQSEHTAPVAYESFKFLISRSGSVRTSYMKYSGEDVLEDSVEPIEEAPIFRRRLGDAVRNFNLSVNSLQRVLGGVEDVDNPMLFAAHCDRDNIIAFGIDYVLGYESTR